MNNKPEQGGAARLSLGPILDLRAAAPLRESLLALQGQAVTVDGSGVQRLGGLCLQVLLSAAQTWAAEGERFCIADASPALADALALMGAPSLAATHLGAGL